MQTPISNRLMDWLVYGTQKNKETPLQQNLENHEERTKRFKSILEMK